MADHKTPRGEESTYLANGGKQTFPYNGKHRKVELPKGVHGESLGSRKNANPKYTGEND